VIFVLLIVSANVANLPWHARSSDSGMAVRAALGAGRRASRASCSSEMPFARRAPPFHARGRRPGIDAAAERLPVPTSDWIRRSLFAIGVTLLTGVVFDGAGLAAARIDAIRASAGGRSAAAASGRCCARPACGARLATVPLVGAPSRPQPARTAARSPGFDPAGVTAFQIAAANEIDGARGWLPPESARSQPCPA
jgi:hypothetical protein